MYLSLDKEREMYRALGYIAGLAATMEDNPIIRAAIYGALEQIENALTEEPAHD
jgi:hypothetical protein